MLISPIYSAKQTRATVASRPLTKEPKRLHFDTNVKGDIEHLRKGEYKDCGYDLLDYYKHREKNMPITVVPHPNKR